MPDAPILTEDVRDVDVCILGTGLTESLAAAAIARQGKRVLHMDRERMYGGCWRALNLAEFVAWAETDGAADTSEVDLALADRDVDGFTVIDLESRCPASCFRMRSCSWDPFGEKTDEEKDAMRDELLKRPCAWSVDLVPRLLFGKSETVDVLVESGVARYLEFQGLRSARVLTTSGLVGVPLTKNDIFQDPVLTLPEKRRLMGFITSMVPFAGSLAFESPANLGVDQAHKVRSQHDEVSPEAMPGIDFNEPWCSFLTKKNLSSRLQDFLTYAICLWDWSQPAGDDEPHELRHADGKLTTGQGLRCLGRFVSSLGMYGRGTAMPLLYPTYGASEIAQGFARMCALHKGTSVLRTSVSQLLATQDSATKDWHVAGVVTNRGEVIRTRAVISSSDHFLQKEMSETTGNPDDCRVACARMVVITDRPLLGDDGVNLCVVPPSAAEPALSNVVQVLQLNWATEACPKGKYVLYLSQAAQIRGDVAEFESGKIFGDLHQTLSLLLQHCVGDDGKKCCLFQCVYLHCPRPLSRRWKKNAEGGEVLASCLKGCSLILSEDPPAVPQLLAGGEVTEARKLFLNVPVFGGEAPTPLDFLKKPDHVAREEMGTVTEDLEHFNAEMQKASCVDAPPGGAAATDLEKHSVENQGSVTCKGDEGGSSGVVESSTPEAELPQNADCGRGPGRPTASSD